MMDYLADAAMPQSFVLCDIIHSPRADILSTATGLHNIRFRFLYLKSMLQRLAPLLDRIYPVECSLPINLELEVTGCYFQE